MIYSSEIDEKDILEETVTVHRKIHAVTNLPIEESWYDKEGELHCLTHAAYREFNPFTGRVVFERWIQHGVEDRLPHNLPTEITWSDEREAAIQTAYCVRGQLHRDNNLPARISCLDSGVRIMEEFWFRGELHRDGGLPAVICYDGSLDENIKYQEFYIHGRKISRNDIKPAP